MKYALFWFYCILMDPDIYTATFIQPRQKVDAFENLFLNMEIFKLLKL